MAIITPSLLKSLFTGYKSQFQAGLDMAKPQYTEIASVINSGTASNTYGWLGQWPAFREWVGDRVMNDMAAHSYQIFNKQYESTVNVQRTDIEDENLGVYAPMMQEMGRATAVFPDQLVFELLRQGDKAACYDKQPFFSTDHPVAPKSDGTGTAKKTSNLTKKQGFTGAPWYLLDTTRAIKPLIFQSRKSPKFVSMTTEQDESVFMRGEYRYGVDMRCHAGFGFWQMAHCVQSELTLETLWAAYSAMRSQTADGGRPLAIRPNKLVVPASLEKQATQLLERELITDGTTTVSNELRGRFEVVVADYL